MECITPWWFCLNPYSNGLLSESLAESILRFPHFFILQKSLLFLRELVQLELLKMNTLSQRPKQAISLYLFRKCTNLK